MVYCSFVMTVTCLIASLSDYEQNMGECWRGKYTDKEMNGEWRDRSEVLSRLSGVWMKRRA